VTTGCFGSGGTMVVVEEQKAMTTKKKKSGSVSQFHTIHKHTRDACGLYFSDSGERTY